MDSENQEKAKEPQDSYGKNRIQFFGSFEEMNEFDLKEMAKLTPVQRLQNMTGMLLAMYKTELQTPMSKSIFFK